MAEQDLSGLIDVAALERYVAEHIPGEAAPLVVRKHVAGFSNETFYVSRGAERWVLRRPPRGELLPTAHDVVREHRFLAALHGRARVPRPLALCEDRSVIGAPFYLMERMDGEVIRDSVPAAYDTMTDRRKIGEEIVGALVELHAVDWREAGLTGRGDDYTARQVARWSRQWELTRPRTRELKGLDEVAEWLAENVPQPVPPTVVHGDYKLDNVMFAEDEPRLVAILDWEMATIGDPLADLGWLLASWGDPGYPPPPPGWTQDGPPVGTLEGFPDIGEMAALYGERSGRSMHDFAFYHVLAVYKLAIIVEGLYMHYLEKTAANPDSARGEWRVPMQIDRMHRLIAGAGHGNG